MKSAELIETAQRSTYQPTSRRRILCISPAYAPSFGTFEYAYTMYPNVGAFMPPQGLLVIASVLPREWEVRVVDENICAATDKEFQWADAVLISGMHVQRLQIEAINERAHRADKVTVLGGPSVSACPEYYPDVDILHIGEIGDATDALIERIDRDVRRPLQQVRLTTIERRPLSEFPVPAYELIDMPRYLLGSIQYSSGCPYLCEFCDIPELYGRIPRLKTPEQIITELDIIVGAGARAVYFVDDNFIGNRKATRVLLPHLIEWQRRRGYPIQFACEATLDIAQRADILAQMREANFTTLFCGIESPEPEALNAMQKKQNLRQPIIEAVEKLNQHGMEVVAGIILGLDTDTQETADRLIAFIDDSQIPMLTINLLYALPKTPLYRRLEAENRLSDDITRASNVVFKMPYATVIDMWRRCISAAYDPPRLFQRFAYQTEVTFPNRLSPPRQVRARDIVLGVRLLSRILWRVGVRADYRRTFWEVVGPLIRQGRIDEAAHIGMVSHHLISFTRMALQGSGEMAFYSDPSRPVRVSG